MSEVEGWRDGECMRLIHALRSHEGDEVLILCDNPGFGSPNNAVECCGSWTEWADKRFTGDTLLDALSAAWIKRSKSDDPVPYPARSPSSPAQVEGLPSILRADLGMLCIRIEQAERIESRSLEINVSSAKRLASFLSSGVVEGEHG